MIGSSTSELCFIYICIFFLHYLAPACIVYCLLLVISYGLRANTYRFSLIFETVAILESIFYLFVYLPYRSYLQHAAVHPPQLNREERKKLFTKCNENIPDIEAYLRSWFLGAQVEEIKKDNMKEFFLWAFFNRGGLPGNDDEELEEYIAETEISLGRAIAPGRGKAQALRLTLDKVDMLHRSLTWYFVSYNTCMMKSLLKIQVCWLCRLSDLYPFTITWVSILPTTALTFLHPLPFSPYCTFHST